LNRGAPKCGLPLNFSDPLERAPEGSIQLAVSTGAARDLLTSLIKKVCWRVSVFAPRQFDLGSPSMNCFGRRSRPTTRMRLVLRLRFQDCLAF
jgi:hypothetical protein